jgi:PIN domain nuclease of toxin-antitoxin system
MRLLLDTHVAIWAVDAASRLPPRIVDMIEDQHNDVFVSAVTIWEIAIKSSLTRVRDPMPFSAAQALSKFLEAEFVMLPVTAAHAVAVENLAPLHGDPFDRLLVAQA